MQRRRGRPPQVTPKVFRPLELLERLNAADVRYVVVGGLAVTAWGYVRGTDDVDIVPDPDADNLDRLAGALEELEGRVVVGDGVLEPAIRTFLRTGDKTLVRTDLGEVDVLQSLPTIPRFDQLETRASRTDLGGVRVLVCSLEDLRAMKRAADRTLDRADLEALDVAHPEADDG